MKDKGLACYQDLVSSLPRLPENLLAFLKDHIANLQININHTDGRRIGIADRRYGKFLNKEEKE